MSETRKANVPEATYFVTPRTRSRVPNARSRSAPEPHPGFAEWQSF